MKTIVYYYSHKGSNRFLANRISQDLECEIEEIKPILNVHILMLLGINFGNKKLKINPQNYERIILCGPIWMGKLIVPLKNFVKKYFNSIKSLTFVTCCGSNYEKKDEKFGHNFVFKEIKNLLKEKCHHCEAFPITLVFPEDLKDEGTGFMKIHLNEENFKGEILDRYGKFIKRLQ